MSLVSILRWNGIFSRPTLTPAAAVGLASTVRRCSVNQPKTPKYQLVYQFPYIVPMRVAARLKIYQTVATMIAAPWIYTAAQHGQILPELAIPTIVTSVLALGTLYYLGYITRRLVGLVGIDKGKETVKIAHMTFWGNRKDVIVPLKTIIPLTEINASPRDLYMNLKTYDNTANLFLSLRFGGVKDIESFELIFGKLRS